MLMTQTRQGRYFAAIGDNTMCATFIGIPVRFTKTLAFVLSGFFAAAAGIMFASRIGMVAPMAGAGAEMRAIAACVWAASAFPARLVPLSVRLSARFL